MQQFDQLWRSVQEIEKKLIMYHALFGDELKTSNLIAIVRIIFSFLLVHSVYVFLDRDHERTKKVIEHPQDPPSVHPRVPDSQVATCRAPFHDGRVL